MKFARYKHDSDLSYAEGATLVFELLKTKPEIITQIFLRPTEKYGEDNADYLIEIESSWENNYSTLGYIHSKIYDSEENLLRTKQEAADRNWNLREVDDDLRLLRMMTDGTWNDREFLILKPGERIAPDYTGLKLKAEPYSE